MFVGQLGVFDVQEDVWVKLTSSKDLLDARTQCDTDGRLRMQTFFTRWFIHKFISVEGVKRVTKQHWA